MDRLITEKTINRTKITIIRHEFVKKGYGREHGCRGEYQPLRSTIVQWIIRVDGKYKNTFNSLKKAKFIFNRLQETLYR